MRCLTNVAQKVPADYADQLHHFRQTIIRLRKANGIDPSAIFNMDQTMCRFDMPRARTNDSRGKKTIRVKTTRAEKKGFTVALAATASGEKLPAVIIFKDQGGVLGARVRRNIVIPFNIWVRATANGWMTTPEYHHWLRNVYGQQHGLLVVDSYKPHQLTESQEIVWEQCGSEVVIIPRR